MKRMKKLMTVLCASCALLASVIAVAPPTLAATRPTSTALESWYQQSGHAALEHFLADSEQLGEADASTTASAARRDCSDFTRDAHAALEGASPPQPVLKQEYRYFLLAAIKSFTACMTGISSSNDAQVFEGVQGGAQAVGAAVRIIRGAQKGRVLSVPPSTVNLDPPIPASVLIPQCEADFKVLEVALEAYAAEHTANLVPPAAWSAATYSRNFTPLETSKDGGPFLNQTIETTYYVLEYDSSGKIWVEPPGTYDTSYDAARGSFTACAAVVK